MADEATPARVGRRLVELRRAAGLTAQELADRVPGSGISKTVITNVENGRKRDLTTSESIVLAAALDVPLMALLFDLERPFDRLDLPGLPERYSRLSVAEYITLHGGDLAEVELGPGTRLKYLAIAEILEAERMWFDWISLSEWAEDPPSWEEPVRRIRPDGSILSISEVTLSPENLAKLRIEFPSRAMVAANLLDQVRKSGGIPAGFLLRTLKLSEHRRELADEDD